MPIDPVTERVLVRQNPWLAGRDAKEWLAGQVPAGYVERQARLPLERPVCLVVGPRQAGKSTLAWRELQRWGGPVLLVNAEEPSMRSWLRSPTLFADDIERRIGAMPALFFEEIQNLPEAGLFLKGLADLKLGVPIVATGSSSFHLLARTRESLAGRAHRTLLLPFSLDELEPPGDRPPLATDHARRERVSRMVVYGGYPRVVLGPSPGDTLSELVEAFVLRDVSDRFRIQHVSAFRKVIELAARQVGNLVVAAEWAAIAGVAAATINDYLQILGETHVLSMVRPFLGGKRAEVTSARKAYFVDNGLRNHLFGGFHPLVDRADAGALLENFAFGEIWKAVNPILDGVHYWRSKSGAEVDFVVEHQGRLLGVEVKLGDVRNRVTRSARSFVEAYEPDLLLVVNEARGPDLHLGRTAARFVRPEDLGHAVRAFVAG